MWNLPLVMILVVPQMPSHGYEAVWKTGTEHEKAELLESIVRREEELQERGEVRYVSLTTVASNGLPIRADLTACVFCPDGGEKWISKSVRLVDVEDTPPSIGTLWERLAQVPDVEIDVWDGSRHLGIVRRGEWRGGLFLEMQTTRRSGALRMGLLPGEKWLSERLAGWILDYTFSVGDSRFWLFRNQSDESPRSDIHRIETRTDLGNLPIRYMVSTVDRKRRFDPPAKDATREDFFRIEPDEMALIDDKALSWKPFNGVFFPETVELTQTYADSMVVAEIVVQARSMVCPVSAREIPPEANVEGILIWDEFLETARYIGKGQAIDGRPQQAHERVAGGEFAFAACAAGVALATGALLLRRRSRQ